MDEKYLEAYNIDVQSIKKLEGYESLNYRIEDKNGNYSLLKIYKDAAQLELIQSEIEVIDSLSKILSIELSTPILNNASEHISHFEDGSFCRMMHFIEGHILKDEVLNSDKLKQIGNLIAELHLATKEMNISVISARSHSWELQNASMISDKIQFIQDPRQQALAHYFLDQFLNQVFPVQHNLPKGIIHNDLNEQNIIFQDGNLKGIIDFGDLSDGPYVYDLSIALAYLMMVHEDHLMVLTSVLEAYSKLRKLSKTELDVLYLSIVTRAVCSVSHSAENRSKNTATEYILSSESIGWWFIEKWITVNPLKIRNLAYKIFGYETEAYDPVRIEDRRNRHISSALKMSYDEPIHFHSAAFQYMYDQEGNCYLDAYNNIPLVGHNHPRISEAISRQVRTLNTNTRYHYELLGQYAEALIERCPKHLTKLIFVNSGSAAADLAVRIAQCFTQAKTIAALEYGYHGNTGAAIEMSHYKYSNSGGAGQEKHILKLPLAKSYLTQYPIAEYIEQAKNILDASKDLAAIIAEPISGCGGQVVMDAEYFQFLQQYAQDYNVPFIIDEVQTGFGRIGTHFWAHEAMDLKPDIMILGKPMGNAHPLAAVVMTDALSEAFDNGMEYFSSFGGNPVSCAVGLEVLQILESESLQQHALEVGNYFVECLSDLQEKFPQIGDVRGSGLFLGVEIINPETHAGDGQLAKQIKEYLKSNFVLSSTDGKLNNVLKIKPPLCFSKENVDRYCALLSDCLSEKQ